MGSDALKLAAAIGLEFSNVLSLIEESETLLFGARAPGIAAHIDGAVGSACSSGRAELASGATRRPPISMVGAARKAGAEHAASSSAAQRRRFAGKQSSGGEQPAPTGQPVRHLFLPEEVLSVVATFSGNPPAVYALCIVSSAFHNRSAQGQAVLATRLLRDALMSSLQRVLTHHKIPLPAVSFASMRSADGTPGAVLSGSTMVQVVLGEVWTGSDIDVFTLAPAAPAVRTQLVQNGFTVARFHNSYEDNGNGMTAYLLETKVHHVEGWAFTPEDSEEFNFAQSCEYGERASSFFSSVLDLIPVVVPRDAALGIRTLPGTPLSFNFDLYDKLDVVVGNSSCKNARELLQSFDIIICSTSYDGLRFHIPHPHQAFRRQSPLEPKRLAMMKAFAAAWRKQKLQEPPDFEDIVDAPWFQALEGVMRNAGIKTGDLTLEEHPDLCGRYYWNFFARLFQRHRKYSQRGIELLGAPAGFADLAGTVTVQDINPQW